MIPATENLEARFGTDSAYTIERTSDLPLAFEGWLVAAGAVGDAADPDDWDRFTRVRLYITKSRKYVIQVQKGSRTGRHVSDAHASGVFEACVAWIRENNNGKLGGATSAMLKEAEGAIPWLRDVGVVRV